MENKTVLITGITGFLGRHLVKYLHNFQNIKIIGIANSQYKIAKLAKEFTNIEIHCINITSTHFANILEDIFEKHKINYVIHTAAIKYIEIAEDNIMTTIATNILAVDTLLRFANKYKVDNLVAISTDKSNNPKNIYGMSKYMMEKLVLQNGYSVYQGVNFFWSDGSVLDIWYKQMKNNDSITVSNFNFIRYFNTVNDICKYIIDNIDTKNAILVPKTAYKISVKQCFDIFCDMFKYDKYIEIGEKDIEKVIEDIDHSIEIIELSNDELLEIFKQYKNYIWLQ